MTALSVIHLYWLYYQSDLESQKSFYLIYHLKHYQEFPECLGCYAYYTDSACSDQFPIAKFVSPIFQCFDEVLNFFTQCFDDGVINFKEIFSY